MASKTYRNCTRTAHLSAYTWPFRSAMNRVPNSFTTGFEFQAWRPPSARQNSTCRGRDRIKCSPFHALAPNRSRVPGRLKSNAVVPPTVSIERVSNRTVPPSASAILSALLFRRRIPLKVRAIGAKINY